MKQDLKTKLLHRKIKKPNPAAAKIIITQYGGPHGELGASFSKYAPLNAGEIARASFAYAALGHVHIAPEPQRVDNSLIAYSGFPQG